MRAAYASAINADDPLAGLTVGERPEPDPRDDDWVTVEVRASSLNHHDLWSLRGVGLPADRLPMILGCDAAGVDEAGNEVVVYPGACRTRPIRVACRCCRSGTRARWPSGSPCPEPTWCPSPPASR